MNQTTQSNTQTLTEKMTTLLGTGLTEKVAIYVPSTVEANEEASALSVVTALYVKEQLAKMFGGFTSYEAEGGWVSDTHGLISEAVTVVTAMTTKLDLHENLERLLEIAGLVKREMSQEAVSLEINGTLYFV